MSDPHPLQAADSLQGVTSSGGTMWRAGQLAPSGSAPSPTVSDDTSEADVVRELDTQKYGDCYDSTAPMRVRDVSRQWTMDTDNDGDKN